MSKSSKAFREGKRARRRQIDASKNPHTLSLLLKLQWTAGWLEEDYLLTFVPPAIAIDKDPKYLNN